MTNTATHYETDNLQFLDTQNNISQFLAKEVLRKERQKQQDQRDLHKTLQQQKWIEKWSPLLVALCEPTQEALKDALWETHAKDWWSVETWSALITTTFNPENFTEQFQYADSLKTPQDYTKILALSHITNIQDIEVLRLVSTINTAMMTWKGFDTTQSADQKIKERENIVHTTIENRENTIDQKQLTKNPVCLEKAAATVYRLQKQGFDADIIYGKLNGEWHAAVSFSHNGQWYFFDVTNPSLWGLPTLEKNNRKRDTNPQTAVHNNIFPSISL